MGRIVAAAERIEAWRHDAHRLRRFLRRIEDLPPEPPVPPPLPPGFTLVLPGRGETFVRATAAPALASGARPILLLHGWTGTADQNFFRCYDELGRTRRVVALDHQGHGRGIRSEEPFTLERCADDAAAVLEHLGIDDAIVAGYSMGGPIAMHLARRHPHLVGGLVLAATSLHARDRAVEKVEWFFLRLGEIAPRFTTGRALVHRLVRQAIDDDPSLRPYRAWLLGDAKRGHLPDMLAAGRALAGFDATPWIQELTMPIAVVVTTQDHFVSVPKQWAMARATGARVVELDGDHDAYLVRPDAFAAALVEAADDVEARAVRRPEIDHTRPGRVGRRP